MGQEPEQTRWFLSILVSPFRSIDNKVIIFRSNLFYISVSILDIMLDIEYIVNSYLQGEENTTSLHSSPFHIGLHFIWKLSNNLSSVMINSFFFSAGSYLKIIFAWQIFNLHPIYHIFSKSIYSLIFLIE